MDNKFTVLSVIRASLSFLLTANSKSMRETFIECRLVSRFHLHAYAIMVYNAQTIILPKFPFSKLSLDVVGYVNIVYSTAKINVADNIQ